VLTGARVAVKRRRDGGEEWQQLELSARAKEGARELGRGGKRGSEGQVVLVAFYRGRGSVGVVMVGVNGFNAIEARAR
jgi:hypothetical protein